MMLSGWGRYPVLEARTHAPRVEGALRDLISAEQTVIARGNGKAYGDSAINQSATVEMRHFNRMLAFEPATGLLAVEAGVVLADIIASFLPRGWFPMVTPGTKHVTVGGAIAADVHGKNHHKDGSFRNCVDWVEVMGPDGRVRRCSTDLAPDLFDRTLGGMGLTGIVLRAAIRLRPVETAWIRQSTIPAPNLESAMAAFDTAQDATYAVAWIDCTGTGGSLGRSLVMLGLHANSVELPPDKAATPLHTTARRKLTVPLDLPGVTLNRWSVRAFNALYYRRGAKGPTQALVDWDRYFYPLDAILGWNRIYGRKGFVQFQCVLPLRSSAAGLAALLATIAAAGGGSFLSVLKRFGPQDSAFSFPMEGYTLALDFPVTAKNPALLDRLDRIVLDHYGRFYLAKDSRMSAATLRLSGSRATDFHAWRADRGLARRLRSAQADRLDL